MGVSVSAYRGVQFEGPGSLGAVSNDLIEVFLDPSAGRLQADDLETGIYSFSSKFEERIGSYSYFDEFRTALAKLVDVPFPSEAREWQGVPFGELLYATDAHVLMGPAMVRAFLGNLGNFNEDASEILSEEHYDTYRVLDKAVNHALEYAKYESGEADGVLYIH